MYVTGIGRCSGLLHVWINFPKIVSCCVGVVGLGAAGTTVGWSNVSAAAVQTVNQYCQAPTQEHLSALPSALRSTVDRLCGCVETQNLVPPGKEPVVQVLY
jgi:hypothetical protein